MATSTSMNIEHWKTAYFKVEKSWAELLTNAMASLFKEITGRPLEDHDVENLWYIMRFA